jgi:hypothetical protein
MLKKYNADSSSIIYHTCKQSLKNIFTRELTFCSLRLYLTVFFFHVSAIVLCIDDSQLQDTLLAAQNEALTQGDHSLFLIQTHRSPNVTINNEFSPWWNSTNENEANALGEAMQATFVVLAHSASLMGPKTLAKRSPLQPNGKQVMHSVLICPPYESRRWAICILQQSLLFYYHSWN